MIDIDYQERKPELDNTYIDKQLVVLGKKKYMEEEKQKIDSWKNYQLWNLKHDKKGYAYEQAINLQYEEHIMQLNIKR